MTSILLHGAGGAGKSFIESTSPGPMLIVDTEAGAHKMPRPVEQWDYSTGTYPKTSDRSIHFVVVETKKDMDRILEALHTPDAPWTSFWIDSYTVYAKNVDNAVNGAGSQAKDSRQDYKKLLRELEPQMISLNHIVERADRKLEVIGVTAWQQGEKVAPQITGGMARFFDHTFDLVGHVAMTFDNGKIGQTMHIMPTRGIEAKAPVSLYKKYGESITDPDLTQLITEMHLVQ